MLKISWKFGAYIFCSFWLIEQNVELDDKFCNWLRQSWPKVLEHLSAFGCKLIPPLPHAMLLRSKCLIVLWRCPNIVWWGGGKGKTTFPTPAFPWHLVTDIFTHSKVSRLIALRKREVFQVLFARIVWVICKIYHLISRFAL